MRGRVRNAARRRSRCAPRHTRRVRRLALIAVAACALAASCGDDEPPAEPRVGVRLSLSAPASDAQVREASVLVRGQVRPAGAKVMVDGQAVRSVDGEFSESVSLDAGVNVIDVLASARERRPALTAIRVRRLVTVTVPDLIDQEPDSAEEELRGLGLQPERVTDPGDLLDDLLGRDPSVCRTSPDAGSEVDPGSTVELFVAPRC